MPRPSDTRSVDALFAAATDWTVEDGEGDWSAVSTLQSLGTRAVVDRAQDLTRAEDPRLCARGVDILAQLGSPGRTFSDDCLRAILDVASRSAEPKVLKSVASALGHLPDPRSTSMLLSLADHEDADVRWSVAIALGSQKEVEAIPALIRMTEDPEDAVRDWATFGIGINGTHDTPEGREALFRRMSDPDAAARIEALCGLARWGDGRSYAPLIEALRREPENGELWLPAKMLLKLDPDSEPEVDALIAGLEGLLATR